MVPNKTGNLHYRKCFSQLAAKAKEEYNALMFELTEDLAYQFDHDFSKCFQ